MADLISIIVSVYHEPLKILEKSLNSIRNQSYKNIEILVALDDPYNKKAEAFLKKIEKKDKRIRIFINPTNLRLPRTHNKLIKLSKGKYIAHMDADDIAKEDRLEKELEYLKINNLDFVASNVKDIDMKGRILGTGTNYPSTNKNIYKFLKLCDCLPSSSWLVKKSVLIQINGYRNLDVCEDYDLIIRAALIGIKFGLLKEPLIYYRYNPDGVSKRRKTKLILVSYFIKAHFKNGLSFSIEQLEEFLCSSKGIRYFNDLEKLDIALKRKKIIWIIELFFNSKIIRTTLSEKLIRKVSSKK